ncbi:uncharacterized protein LOC132040800 [Lycium ferocissimum]|uniref:uncharacterized protein LOC132040800 n=1 Tax=Lycium ferocissimum TaxID=112874 RepID=UPI002814FA95|nr:uncharacterized protein LOC132040800 [Lycium ferocissimum]XP_059287458.1 uncharacterized protein LOC132040800 [Lycium ferocissimum]XP_059287459.1 uncharacterized protein LOC132040800 [Lycium ferocissimum]XP_059287460.1 uncharacterized protein LOC132040800 [Lycium ferocissimum]XP_059287461.1 uncharacterized protein LOC132040800 [Lycium ferocissimum]
MARHPFEGLEIMYEAQRLPRESAHHFKRKIREMTSIDEDYAHFLMLSLDYHKESTNEGGNEGPAVARDKLNHGEYEDRDEDEVDPDYEEFLANAEKYGNSYLAKSGQSFECKTAEDDLRVIVGDNCTFGKEGSSILMDASSAKQLENVEDICPLQTVVSDFEWNVKALLERPYDQKEYIGLWKLVKSRTPSHLRNGKVYTTRRLGKSYLDHYKDLHENLKKLTTTTERS